MNTPAHLLLGGAAFARPAKRRYLAAAFFGALMPDLSLYVLAGVSLFVLGLPPEHVFGTLYFSDAWQTVFAIDNSIPLWLAILGVGLWRKWRVVAIIAGAALLHIALDLPLHHDDGRAHFWPFSMWVYESPLSYWDSGHGAGWIAPIAAALAALSAALLMMRFTSWPVRGVVLALLAAELWTARQWIMFF